MLKSLSQIGNDMEARSRISTNGNLHPDLRSRKSTDAPDSEKTFDFFCNICYI